MCLQITSLWPKNIASAKKINNIEQIVYSLSPNTDKNDMIDIKANNIYISDQGSYFWCVMPITYKEHLARAFLRMELLLRAFKSDDLEPTSSVLLNKNIVYLDRVLDKIWKEANDAEKAKLMSEEWRSPTLDEWLIVECIVGRHDPDHINATKKKSDLKQDAKGLGEYITFFHLYKIIN
jgi:hypothetical protein